jgi:hypothetical protein
MDNGYQLKPETLQEDHWRLVSEVLLILQLRDCRLALRDSLHDSELATDTSSI